MEAEQIPSATEELLYAREQSSNPLASELEEHALQSQNISTIATESIKNSNYILKKNAQVTTQEIISQNKREKAKKEGKKLFEAYESFYGKKEEIFAHFKNEQILLYKKEDPIILINKTIDEKEMTCTCTYKDLKLNKQYKIKYHLKNLKKKEEENETNSNSKNIKKKKQKQAAQFFNNANFRNNVAPSNYYYYYYVINNGYYTNNFGYK